ncbi:MAG: toll/interleukin-1 receptor domain-containing protein [Candidatus Bathyarchaeota archaeon]|nr:toll/interleukin-1 receptor domain-containing protein [Candidatus Bathyarchaeota archaeon]
MLAFQPIQVEIFTFKESPKLFWIITWNKNRKDLELTLHPDIESNTIKFCLKHRGKNTDFEWKSQAMYSGSNTLSTLEGDPSLFLKKGEILLVSEEHAVLSSNENFLIKEDAKLRAHDEIVQVLGRDRVFDENPLPKKTWDLFISHASEDKEEIARPLANALMKAGYNVWFDEFELKIGDSLRESIENGLSKSKFGVVILSPNFFTKNWTQTELDGLVTKNDGARFILPVWHNISADFVKGKSLMLASRVAAKTTHGINAVVEEIKKVVSPSNDYM